MGRYLKRNLAWIFAGLVLWIVVLSYTQAYLMKDTVLSGDAGPWYLNPIWSLPAIPAALIGGLLASRRAGNHYGWIWIGLGAGSSLTSLAQQSLQWQASLDGTNDFLVFMGIFAASSSWSVQIALMGLSLLLFPNGHPPTPRWNIIYRWIWISLLIILTLGWMTSGEGFTSLANPAAVPPPIGDIASFLILVAVLVIFLGILLSALSLLVRYRLASGIERQQIKWFAYAATLLVIVFLLTGFGDTSIPEVLAGILQIISLSLLPIAVGIAVLRYRLYEIDIIIRRTLVYTGLSGGLGIIYFGSVVLLQEIFRSQTREESQLAIIISTLVIAAMFSPFKQRLQATIDRRFYRRKYNTAKSIEALSATIKDEVDLESLSERLVQVVDDAIQPEHVSLWLR